jgi:hypothetical protein
VIKGILVIIAITILALGSSLGGEPRYDPVTKEIRLLHLGKAWNSAGSPGPVFIQDPRISWSPVPSHAWSMGLEAFRMLRLYLPRSRDRFLSEFDVVAIGGMEALHLRPDFQQWVKEGLSDRGLGFIMADDSSSFGTSGSHTSWYLVPIGEIIPVDDKPIGGSPYGTKEAFHVVPVDTEHEFTRNIPWQEVWLEANNRPWPKEGSTVVTKMSGEYPLNRGKVLMAYWELGAAGGRSVAWIHAWNWSPDFWRWRYSHDVIAHVVYFASSVAIPEDLVLVHSIRERIHDYYFARVYALSTLDFADKFRANTAAVEALLDRTHDLKENADRLFLDQDYEGAAATMDGALSSLDETIREAIRAKDRALVWVFAIEWLVVSATSMLVGALVWSLMVRRRLYREVGETRLRHLG